jgi:hypothetical protein
MLTGTIAAMLHQDQLNSMSKIVVNGRTRFREYSQCLPVKFQYVLIHHLEDPVHVVMLAEQRGILLQHWHILSELLVSIEECLECLSPGACSLAQSNQWSTISAVSSSGRGTLLML